jgi:hypothetical protein
LYLHTHIKRYSTKDRNQPYFAGINKNILHTHTHTQQQQQQQQQKHQQQKQQ